MIKRIAILTTLLAGLHGNASAQETIKVGFLNVDGGGITALAKYFTESSAFAIDTLNAQGGALGRKYELVTQTYAGSPAAGMAAAAKLVDQQGVSFFAGLFPSSVSLAISSKLPGMNALMIDTTAASSDLTGKACQANYFRIGVNDAMIMNAMREQIKKSGAKTWNAIVSDYAAGHDFSKSFSALVAESGGTMQMTLFAPPITTDFGSYISQLAAKPADGLMVMFTGTSAISLAKQQQQFGLFSKFKAIVAHSAFTNETFIDGQGDSTVGTNVAQSYHWSMTGERNAAFVKAFEARFKRKPNYYDADTYLSFTLLHAAIVKANSTEVAAVRTALSGLKSTTLVGDVEMRAGDHQLLRPLVGVQAFKVSEGKGDFKLKTVEPVALVTSSISPECKL